MSADNPYRIGDHPGMVERLYSRAGRWYLRLLLTFAGASIPVIAALFSALIIPNGDLSAAEWARLLLVVVPWMSLVGVATEIAVAHGLRPLLEWFDEGRPPHKAERAWDAAVPGLASAILVKGATVAAAGAVAATVYVMESTDLGIIAVIAGVVASTATVLAGALLHYLLWERALGPVVRELVSQLPDQFEAPRRSLSLSNRLLMIIPILNVLTGFTAASLASQDSPTERIAVGVGVALGTTLLLVMPLTLMLRRSLLTPMNELLEAMSKVKRGDLDARLPVLTADELGAIAEHFNSMLAGLEERQRLSGQNLDLESQVAEQVEEVRASRARIIAASDAERRRVERNIHDGAQQRLVALALQLRLLEHGAGSTASPELRDGLAEAGASLSAALGELKELARGLHPQILTTDGLRPALKQLASRSPVPVSVEACDGRFEDAIESTVYFVVSEALANVAKYSKASRAEVQVRREASSLCLQVIDDGVGGADPAAGSGLSGLGDRVEAVEGRLMVESAPGAGTVVRAVLPLR